MPANAKKTMKKQVTPEQRYKMIEEAAYLLAEKEGFLGDTVSFWLAAEKQIEASSPKPGRPRAKKVTT